MFYRGHVQRRKLLKPRSHTKKKNSSLRQPGWDNTIQDLTVHAASPEEMLRRQIRHKSKNVDAARRELTAKRKGLPVDLVLSPAKVELEMKKLAILREVLYDHNDLNEVLRRTDKTMASVKTLFHDSTCRKSGRPNITLAPGKIQGRDPPVSTATEQPSKFDALSDSVMDSQALNDGMSSSDESEYEDDVQFESKVDYDRFMSLLKDSMNNTRNPKAADSELMKTPEKNSNVRSQMQQSALNCTEEVKRTLSRISPIKEKEENKPSDNKMKVDDQTRKIDHLITSIASDTSKLQKKLNNSTATAISVQPRANITQCNMTYDDLQGAMAKVEKSITAFEGRTGRREEEQTNSGTGLAGFTATLIDAVTRLISYVNEGEIKTQEVEKKIGSLQEKLDHQQAVTEALTMELVNTQKVIKQGQEQVKSLEEKLKLEKETQNRESREAMSQLEERFNNLTQTVCDLENKLVISENTIVVDEAEPDVNGIQVFEAGCSSKQEDKDAEELALKTDMVRLLDALKSQNDKVVASQRAPSPPAAMPFPTSLTFGSTQEAAQTIASVESHLRHLQLQHAEAQHRMDELTQQAKIFSGLSPPGSVASSQHVASSSVGVADSLDLAPLPVKLQMEAAKPLIQQSNVAWSTNEERVVPFSSSPPCHDVPELMNPLLVTSVNPRGNENSSTENLFGSDGGSFKFLEQDTSETESNISLTSSIMSSPHAMQQQKVVLSSIQRTQLSLEDRISELNRQHSEAQGRLQKLVARRRNDQVGKRVQVSLPTTDMFETPQVSKKPQSKPTQDPSTAAWHTLTSHAEFK
ncbi:uncharacterized protein LOC143446519 [Clavelina lepadiformis]|uniref:uncharacterized protein LOC143446519 n=1 Tax=Clavelina lepadiformis TaxID=159417 RepID=UPI004041A5EE